jgi:hypothetical protein
MKAVSAANSLRSAEASSATNRRDYHAATTPSRQRTVALEPTLNNVVILGLLVTGLFRKAH